MLLELEWGSTEEKCLENQLERRKALCPSSKCLAVHTGDRLPEFRISRVMATGACSVGKLLLAVSARRLPCQAGGWRRAPIRNYLQGKEQLDDSQSAVEARTNPLKMMTGTC